VGVVAAASDEKGKIMGYKSLMHMTDDERRQERIRRRLDTCIHHNGFFNKICGAGVDYKTVGAHVDLGRDGTPFVDACFKNQTWGEHQLECRFTCGKAEFPTLEQVESDLERQDKEIAEHLEKLSKDICPTHNIAITKKQVGRCVYAVECGCRLYQGKVG
jgi:hypothetical protein